MMLSASLDMSTGSAVVFGCEGRQYRAQLVPFGLGQIRRLALAKGCQEEDRHPRPTEERDDARAATFTLAFGAPTKFPSAAGSLHQIAGDWIGRDEIDQFASLGLAEKPPCGRQKFRRLDHSV